MASAPCPLPQVEETLAPYIHSRQETQRIRRTLTEHVKKQLDEPDQPLSHLLLACPPSGLTAKSVPSETTGLRREYLEALRANAAARTRYDKTKSDLDELQKRGNRADSGRSMSIPSLTADTSIQTYVSLLRLRRYKKKLDVIQTALSKVTEVEPSLIHTDLKSMLKEKLGAPPDAPTLTLESEAPDQDVAELTFKLKKEVLRAKADMDRSKKSHAQAEERAPKPSTTTLEAQVYALQAARDELIGWIEGELAKISEESEVDASAGAEQSLEKQHSNGTQHDAPSQEEIDRIQELYQEYISARTTAIAEVENATSPTPIFPSPSAHSHLSSNPLSPTSPRSPMSPSFEDSKTKKYASLDLLPYIPSLSSILRDEKFLLQQSSYLKRHLTTSTDETNRVIQRLAEESHLVSPINASANAWAEAARRASKETDDFVTQQLKQGDLNLNAAKRTLEGLERKAEAMKELEGTIE